MLVNFLKNLFVIAQAVEEEKQLYERSSRRQVYVNLCINSIKKLRGMNKIESGMTEHEPESEQGRTPESVGKIALSRTSSGESEKLSSDCVKNLTGDHCLLGRLLVVNDLFSCCQYVGGIFFCKTCVSRV